MSNHLKHVAHMIHILYYVAYEINHFNSNINHRTLYTHEIFILKKNDKKRT